MGYSDIKAIETEYNGYRFRSRLEARWAVFFERMNIHYEYEPEGYHIEGGLYLPDFFIPASGWWLEIKPLKNKPELGNEWYTSAWFEDERNHVDFRKLVSVVEGNARGGRFGALLLGSPWPGAYQAILITDKDSFGSPENTISHIGQCTDCGRVGIGYGDYWYELSPFISNQRRCSWCLFNGYSQSHSQQKWAHESAKQARFEHGETP